MTDEPATIVDLLDQASDRAVGEALVFPGERASYPELVRRSLDMARSLRSLGIGKGDAVGILADGGVDYLAFMFGAMRIGAVITPVNSRYKAYELRYLLGHSGVRLLACGQSFVPLVIEAMESSVHELTTLVVLDGEGPSGFVSRGAFDAAATTIGDSDIAAIQRQLVPDDDAIILYTSGTTARPKGCVHSHRSAVAQSGSLGIERLNLQPADRYWTPLPLFHVAAFASILAVLRAACTLCHGGHFAPEAALEMLASERATVAFPAFETIWLAVIGAPGFAAADLSALRIVINIGSPERLRRMQEAIPGAVQLSSIGATEAGGFISIGLVTDSLSDRVNTCGLPMPGMQVRVVDPETGEDQQPGEPGEFLYRGVSRFVRYHRDPLVTAERIDPDGWFHSGDVVTQDANGRLNYLTRLKDMLKVGGENVAALEIEDYLTRHPAVSIVQVVAAPDARYVEVPAAFIELRPGAQVTEAEIIDFCIGRIATFKVPRYVRFISDWPMSGTKIQKFRLRELIAADLADLGQTEAPRIVTR